MAHYHNCVKCGITVAHCSDDQCQADESHPNYGPAYCSIHHPDPKFHVEPTPPPSRK